MMILCLESTLGPVGLIGIVIGNVMGSLDRNTGFSIREFKEKEIEGSGNEKGDKRCKSEKLTF
jgi:hypothetical protein